MKKAKKTMGEDAGDTEGGDTNGGNAGADTKKVKRAMGTGVGDTEGDERKKTQKPKQPKQPKGWKKKPKHGKQKTGVVLVDGKGCAQKRLKLSVAHLQVGSKRADLTLLSAAQIKALQSWDLVFQGNVL